MVAVIVEPKTAANFNNISSDTFTCLHSKNRVNGLTCTTLLFTMVAFTFFIK